MSFWYLQFSKKTNKKNLTLLLWYLKSNCFRLFFGELKAPKRHFEINWPLHRTKVRWRFRKILWPSENIWTLIKHHLPVGLHQKVVSVGSLWQCLAGIRTEYAKTRADSEPRSALFYLIAESEKLFSVPSIVRFFYELDWLTWFESCVKLRL